MNHVQQLYPLSSEELKNHLIESQIASSEDIESIVKQIDEYTQMKHSAGSEMPECAREGKDKEKEEVPHSTSQGERCEEHKVDEKQQKQSPKRKGNTKKVTGQGKKQRTSSRKVQEPGIKNEKKKATSSRNQKEALDKKNQTKIEEFFKKK